MKNDKGFTLVELLGVIVILGIIIAIAIPSVTGITQLIKDNMLEEKATIIEEAAVMYGQDIKGSIINSNLKYNSFPCGSFVISDLVPHYLDKDNDNTCLKKDSTGSVGCIVDPSDDTKYMDKTEIIIYYKNRRIHAKVDLKDELSCK